MLHLPSGQFCYTIHMKIKTQPDEVVIYLRDTKAIAWSGVAFAAGVGCVIAAPVLRSLPFAAVGSLFAVGGGFLLWGAEDTVTTLRRDGVCSVTAKRLVGHTSLVQRFAAADITEVAYVKGLVDNKRLQAGALVDEVYLVLRDGRKLNIMLQRLNSFGPTPTLATEAAQVASFLHAPLNTIEADSLAHGVKNFGDIIDMGRHDPSAPILQRPTQAELDSDDTMMSINNGRNNGK